MGVLVNLATIVVGGLIGFFAKKGLPERVSKTILEGMALCVAFIGITGFFSQSKEYEANALITILSVAVGGALGVIIDLDKKVNSLADAFERMLNRKLKKEVEFSKGFICASMLFCIGAMSIVGPLKAGTVGDNSVLYSKSIIDGITAVIYASAMGIGVVGSAVPVFLLEGFVFLISSFIAPYLTTAMITEMSIVGSVLIFGIGLNMLGLTKIKILNLSPAVFMPIILCMFM